MELWLGTEQSLVEFQAMLEAVDLEKAMLAQQDDADENPVPFDILDGGLGVIHVSGTTVSKPSFISSLFGLHSYEEIKSRLSEAADNSEVKAILLNLDTPGGQAEGVPALARHIKEVSQHVKPVYSFTQGKMMSAGMWYGSAADYVFADEDARLGSIGVIATHTEVTKAMEMEGVKATVFRSAPYKALGHPYEKLTETAKGEISKEIATLHDKFVSALASNTGLKADFVGSKIANGKTFSANEAMSLGLVKQTVGYDRLVAKLTHVLQNSA